MSKNFKPGDKIVVTIEEVGVGDVKIAKLNEDGWIDITDIPLIKTNLDHIEHMATLCCAAELWSDNDLDNIDLATAVENYRRAVNPFDFETELQKFSDAMSKSGHYATVGVIAHWKFIVDKASEYGVKLGAVPK